MLTKIGKAIRVLETSVNTYVIRPYYGGTAEALFPAKDMNGDNYYVPMTQDGNGTIVVASVQNIIISPTNVANGIIIGSGDTEPTVDDYWLEDIITGFTASSPTLSYSRNGYKLNVHQDFAITNNNSSAITIAEVGRCYPLRFATTQFGTLSSTMNNTNNRRCFLLEREVLDTPIVISAGEAGTLRLTTTYDLSSLISSES